MKIITTYLAPDAGTVVVDGMDVQEQALAVRRKIGYMPENVPLYTDMRVHEYLGFVGAARGLDGVQLKQRLDWVVDACGIAPVYKQTIRELSKGFRQRTGLAQALIHDPEILILDEPTSGLDPLQILGIRELIRELGRSKTIIFSTHILQEVKPVTDRVVIINMGRIIADGLIPDLQRQAMGSNRVELAFAESPKDIVRELGQCHGVEAVLPLDSGGAPRRFEMRGAFDQDLLGLVVEMSKEHGWRLRELHESPFSLEDTFIALTKRSDSSRKQSSRREEVHS
jgi:ABC-2 type transport system ATP-binding protein